MLKLHGINDDSCVYCGQWLAHKTPYLHNRCVTKRNYLLKQAREKCWQKCGTVARFKGLALNMHKQNLISDYALASISLDCILATRGAKAEYQHTKKLLLAEKQSKEK